jgi:hypothetical protein
MTTFLGKTVLDCWGLKPVEGDLGIEIEVEAFDKLPREVNEYWDVLTDGSLRGEAKEYVFKKPLSKPVTFKQVKILYELLQNNVKDSMRAGVHVHINCQKLTLTQLFTFMAAYYCLEDLITEEAGEERQGNLFCLRMSDADYINTGILGCLMQRSITADSGIFHNENLRYSAMNLVSLSKFGSLEFRALRTPTTAEKVIDWVDMLFTLKENSVANFANPIELLSAMSANGAAETAKKLLGKYAEKQIAKPHFEKSVYDGVRQIQHWVFLNNWETA